MQDDIAPHLTEMLIGAMQELTLGDPWSLATDIGPVIDDEAASGIRAHIDTARREGRVIAELTAPATGHFIAPTVIRVNGIAEMKREIFGPVLHLATFRSEDLNRVIADINATGYGLTFGLHTRIDNRVDEVTKAIRAGNIYVNRNQIGAVVGSQPFGGEGLSGTGPKAGGPDYLARFTAPETGGIAGHGKRARPHPRPSRPDRRNQPPVDHSARAPRSASAPALRPPRHRPPQSARWAVRPPSPQPQCPPTPSPPPPASRARSSGPTTPPPAPTPLALARRDGPILPLHHRHARPRACHDRTPCLRRHDRFGRQRGAAGRGGFRLTGHWCAGKSRAHVPDPRS